MTLNIPRATWVQKVCKTPCFVLFSNNLIQSDVCTTHTITHSTTFSKREQSARYVQKYSSSYVFFHLVFSFSSQNFTTWTESHDLRFKAHLLTFSIAFKCISHVATEPVPWQLSKLMSLMKYMKHSWKPPK